MPEPIVINIESFAGGMNTSLPPSELQDDECAYILNLELDRRSNLVTRPGNEKLNSLTSFPGRVTSIFQLRKQAGTSHVVATSATKAFKWNSDGSLTDITGSCTLPDNTLWQWVAFNDVAIGVNGGGSGYNSLVKWDGVGNLQPVSGSPASGLRCVTVWNYRVFAAGWSTLYWSSLGDYENWAGTLAGAMEIDPDDGDEITAIVPHRGTLLIFKRDKIYRVLTGVPNTDADQWSVEILTRGVGCVARDSVQIIFDDVLFLSRFGVASLGTLLAGGDVKTSIISDKVSELNTITAPDNVVSTIIPEKAQYWIAVPTEQTTPYTGVVYVLKFDWLQKRVAWSAFNGGCVGGSYHRVLENGRMRLWIGGNTGNIYRQKLYGDVDPFTDDGVEFEKRMVTKSFTHDAPLVRKEWIRWGAALGIITDPTSITAYARFDETMENQKEYSIVFSSGDLGQSLWDIATWDDSLWGGDVTPEVNIVRRIVGSNGRKSVALQLEILNNQIGQAIHIKSLFIEGQLLATRRVSTV